jgi:hypothetical protein
LTTSSLSSNTLLIGITKILLWLTKKGSETVWKSPTCKRSNLACRTAAVLWQLLPLLGLAVDVLPCCRRLLLPAEVELASSAAATAGSL